MQGDVETGEPGPGGEREEDESVDEGGDEASSNSTEDDSLPINPPDRPPSRPVSYFTLFNRYSFLLIL
jgi:hypothetical protein